MNGNGSALDEPLEPLEDVSSIPVATYRRPDHGNVVDRDASVEVEVAGFTIHARKMTNGTWGSVTIYDDGAAGADLYFTGAPTSVIADLETLRTALDQTIAKIKEITD